MDKMGRGGGANTHNINNQKDNIHKKQSTKIIIIERMNGW